MPYPRQTHCPQGHEYSEGNVLRYGRKDGSRKERYCGRCQAAKSERQKREREARLRKLVAGLPAGVGPLPRGVGWWRRHRALLELLCASFALDDPWPSRRPNGKPRGASMKRPSAPRA